MKKISMNWTQRNINRMADRFKIAFNWDGTFTATVNKKVVTGWKNSSIDNRKIHFYFNTN